MFTEVTKDKRRKGFSKEDMITESSIRNENHSANQVQFSRKVKHAGNEIIIIKNLSIYTDASTSCFISTVIIIAEIKHVLWLQGVKPLINFFKVFY